MVSKLSLLLGKIESPESVSTSSIANVELQGRGGLVVCIGESSRGPWTSGNGLDDLPGKKLV